MTTVITTIVHRPYVFMFLVAFLVLGRLYFGGWKKTLLWLVVGYVVAWASEVSSIHNGFPYGLYHYRYENMAGELIVAGVPFWDSLSYPFMIFAGYTTAKFILNSHPESKAKDLGGFFASLRMTAPTALFGSFLTMLLDIIIDPLTVMGDRWFLGNIYYYPNGGQYFGVPITNFAGWFIVPLAVILSFQLVCSLVPKGTDTNLETWKPGNLLTFLNPLFYISIALFNILITIWINEPVLASIDCIILIPIVWLITYRIKQLKHSNT